MDQWDFKNEIIKSNHQSTTKTKIQFKITFE